MFFKSLFGAFSGLFQTEKSKLSGDLSGALGWLGQNWTRLLGWGVPWYAAKAFGPAAGAKAQAILKVLGF